MRALVESRAWFTRLPEYHEPRLWKQAPAAFRRQGFRRLFVRYL